MTDHLLLSPLQPLHHWTTAPQMPRPSVYSEGNVILEPSDSDDSHPHFPWFPAVQMTYDVTRWPPQLWRSHNKCHHIVIYKSLASFPREL